MPARPFELLADQRPLLVCLEDLHWAEPTMLDLVEYIAAFATGSVDDYRKAMRAQSEYVRNIESWLNPEREPLHENIASRLDYSRVNATVAGRDVRALSRHALRTYRSRDVATVHQAFASLGAEVRQREVSVDDRSEERDRMVQQLASLLRLPPSRITKAIKRASATMAKGA